MPDIVLMDLAHRKNFRFITADNKSIAEIKAVELSREKKLKVTVFMNAWLSSTA